jgi:DNA-binding transcriptional LysR family regulator
MDLNQLRVFYHAAKLKSFSLAAEALFVTRPLISIRIKQLEDAYGLKLFERTGKRVELTNTGEVLLSYADKIFNLIKEAENHMEDMKGITFGTLKICTGLTVGTYYLSPLINAFRKKYPKVEIQMKVKNKKGVLEDILSFTDDLGFLGNMEPNENVVVTQLWEDELTLIVSRSHDLAKIGAISPSRLNDQTFIMREKGSGTRELIEEKLSANNISVKTALELGSDEAIKRAVEVGIGVSIVPREVVRNELRRGLVRAVRFLNEPIVMQYCMIHHRNKYISNTIRAFIELAKASSSSLSLA